MPIYYVIINHNASALLSAHCLKPSLTGSRLSSHKPVRWAFHGLPCVDKDAEAGDVSGLSRRPQAGNCRSRDPTPACPTVAPGLDRPQLCPDLPSQPCLDTPTPGSQGLWRGWGGWGAVRQLLFNLCFEGGSGGGKAAARSFCLLPSSGTPSTCPYSASCHELPGGKSRHS